MHLFFIFVTNGIIFQVKQWHLPNQQVWFTIIFFFLKIKLGIALVFLAHFGNYCIIACLFQFVMASPVVMGHALGLI